MSKILAFDQEAQEAMRRGVQKLARAVRVTLGPRGRNVIIEKSFGSGARQHPVGRKVPRARRRRTRVGRKVPRARAAAPGWSQSPPSWSQGLPSWGQTVGAGGGYGPGRPTAGSSRTGPLPMYPMAVGDILDATFRLLRANAKALAPVLLLIAFPFEAIAAYNARNSESLNQVFANLGNPQQQQNATPSSVLIVGYLVMLGIGLMTPVVAGFVCRTIAASYLGEQYRSGQVSRQVWGR